MVIAARATSPTGASLPTRRHDELGRGERARPERAHELRRRVRLPCACGSEAIDERGQQLVRRLGSDLELDLAEASSDALAVEHRHLVVRDLGDALPPRVEERRTPPERLETSDRSQRRRSHVRAQQLERRATGSRPASP